MAVVLPGKPEGLGAALGGCGGLRQVLIISEFYMAGVGEAEVVMILNRVLV